MQLVDDDSNATAHMLLSSGLCDKYFGLHPLSVRALVHVLQHVHVQQLLHQAEAQDANSNNSSTLTGTTSLADTHTDTHADTHTGVHTADMHAVKNVVATAGVRTDAHVANTQITVNKQSPSKTRTNTDIVSANKQSKDKDNNNKKKDPECALVRLFQQLIHILSKHLTHTQTQHRLHQSHEKRKPRTVAEKCWSRKHNNYRALSKISTHRLLQLTSRQTHSQPLQHTHNTHSANTYRIIMPSLMTLLEKLVAKEESMMQSLVCALLDKSTLSVRTYTHSRTNQQYTYLHSETHINATTPNSLSNVNPTQFLSLTQNFEDWLVHVPAWQMPVYKLWGECAAPEPFWRRLLIEQRLGIDGPYTKIDRKDQKIDKVARDLGSHTWQKMLIRRAMIRKVVDSRRCQQESECMLFEDALAIRARQLERLQHFEEDTKAKYDRMGLFRRLFGRCRMNVYAKIGISQTPEALCAPASEAWNQRILQSKRYQAFHKRKLPTAGTIVLTAEDGVPAVIKTLDIDSMNPHLFIASELDDIRLLLIHENNRIHKKFRVTSWITGEAVYFDKHGHHRGARDDEALDAGDWEYKVDGEECWCFGGLHTLGLAARVVEDINVNPRGYLRCSTFVGPQLDVKAINEEQYAKLNAKYKPKPITHTLHSAASTANFNEPVIKVTPSLGNLFGPVPTLGNLSNLGASTSRKDNSKDYSKDNTKDNTSRSAYDEDAELISTARSSMLLPQAKVKPKGRGKEKKLSQKTTILIQQKQKQRDDEYDRDPDEGQPFTYFHARTGFVSSRKLCQDDANRGEFATHRISTLLKSAAVAMFGATLTTTSKSQYRRRMLSATAMKRLRADIADDSHVVRELATVSEYREFVWDELLLDRYTREELRKHVIKIQCLFRLARAKMIVAEMRKPPEKKKVKPSKLIYLL
jgi:hypothetical protein